MKRLIRRIVLSAAYRQSSADCAACRMKDPENRLLWRMPRRRLDLEALRDSMLAVSGRLDPRIGGPPISLATVPAEPRRTLYVGIEREKPLQLLKTFDVADPEQHSPQRYQTTVPQQGLFLLNSPFAGEMARSLAARAKDVRQLYRLALGRDATTEERVRAESFLARERASTARDEPAGQWHYGAAALDPKSGRVRSFRPFAYFTGKTWQAASVLPDSVEGTASLSATGGAPGDDMNHVVVRRWVAPIDATLEIDAKLVHKSGAFEQRFRVSNGIRGWIVSSRLGVLGKWRIDPVPPP